MDDWYLGHEDALSSPMYPDWLERHRTPQEDLDRERVDTSELPSRPLISIVTPVYRTPPAYLRAMIDSVLGQTYDNFELILANASGECREVDSVLASYHDARLRILTIENRSISENTNAAIAESEGDYVGFVDHDDLLEPDCLYRYVEEIDARPQADLLFCDEDLVREPAPAGGETSHVDSLDGLVHFCAKFKPGWNPDLIMTHNYACHLLMVSRRALELTERSGADVTGAQDYDLAFKAAEVAREVVCIPRVLYHWRDHPASIATNRDSKPYAFEAGRLAIQRHLGREGIEATVGEGSFPLSYRVHYKQSEQAIGVICYGERSSETADALRSGKLADESTVIHVPDLDHAHDAMARMESDIVVLVSDRCHGFADGWLDELTAPLARRDDIAMVAPELLAEDGTVASHGLTVCPDGSLTSAEQGLPRGLSGYMTYLCHARDVNAVAGAVVALRRDDYVAGDGFTGDLPDELRIPDLSLTLADAGSLVMVEPYGPVTVCQEANGPSPYACPQVSGSSRHLLLSRHPGMRQGDRWLDPAIDPTSPSFDLSR
ncbi:MAG: glycosyltransferase [Atopobiaceae bacterium]|nr:glycosyltransferase [Atopobiaceae bacterium]MCH4180907.1 glycosyltransferase [Atopobiaceae bacterium]MCH4213990.1 glycosyltransferase [Atopobiaceae bacterium]MCH4276896.1 glycosyltransferase [Atopobiaceae bacterium]MCI1226340.1 glycosyltransferase [Atopobiaceae bacterium]